MNAYLLELVECIFIMKASKERIRLFFLFQINYFEVTASFYLKCFREK